MAIKACVFDLLESPMLRWGDVSAIREFFRQYEEYKMVWAERQAEGVIIKGRLPKSVLPCTDPDLRQRVRKYDMNVTGTTQVGIWAQLQ